MKRIVILKLLIMSSLFISEAQVNLSFNPEENTKYEYSTEIRLTDILKRSNYENTNKKEFRGNGKNDVCDSGIGFK